MMRGIFVVTGIFAALIVCCVNESKIAYSMSMIGLGAGFGLLFYSARVIVVTPGRKFVVYLKRKTLLVLFLLYLLTWIDVGAALFSARYVQAWRNIAAASVLLIGLLIFQALWWFFCRKVFSVTSVGYYVIHFIDNRRYVFLVSPDEKKMLYTPYMPPKGGVESVFAPAGEAARQAFVSRLPGAEINFIKQDIVGFSLVD